MKDVLSEYSRKVQAAWQHAFETKSHDDFEAFERLEDEYYILLENDRHHRKRNYISDNTMADC